MSFWSLYASSARGTLTTFYVFCDSIALVVGIVLTISTQRSIRTYRATASYREVRDTLYSELSLLDYNHGDSIVVEEYGFQVHRLRMLKMTKFDVFLISRESTDGSDLHVDTSVAADKRYTLDPLSHSVTTVSLHAVTNAYEGNGNEQKDTHVPESPFNNWVKESKSQYASLDEIDMLHNLVFGFLTASP